MNAITTSQITFKDGSVWEKGTRVNISVNPDRPTVAVLYNLNTEAEKRVRSIRLYRWFANDFISIDEHDIEECIMDDVCPTLTGDMVEPDGWDSNGFPSLLLAMSLI